MSVSWQVVKHNDEFKLVVERDGKEHDLFGNRPDSFYDGEWSSTRQTGINDAWFGVASMKYGYIRYEGILYVFDKLALAKYKSENELPEEVRNAFSWLKSRMKRLDVRQLH